MLWKAEVPISEGVLKAEGAATRFCRVFGIFPMVTHKIKSQTYLRGSATWVLYSFTLGAILVFLTYHGLLEDMWDDETSIRIKSHTEMYVMFCDISVVQSVTIFAIFAHAFRYQLYFDYIKHLNEVDATIPPDNPSSAQQVSLWMAAAIFLSTLCMISVDMYLYVRVTQRSVINQLILRRYLAFNITYFIMMTYHYQFWHLGHGVLRRLQQLNKSLQDLHVPQDTKVENVDIGQVIDSLNKKGRGVTLVKPKSNDFPKPTGLSILKLASIYMHLSDAVGNLNQLLGITNVVTIVGILWHLIEAPFHVLSEIMGSRKDLFYITMNAFWCIYHFCRLIMFVEPCYRCSMQVVKMQSFICNALCSPSISDQVRSELETFSIVLSQGRLEFNAAGLTKIDRSLVTALLGTITTYLVILIQFQSF